jgi:hypothetical protein
MGSGKEGSTLARMGLHPPVGVYPALIPLRGVNGTEFVMRDA